MSTIVMRVDLDCDKCYKKIRKVLCKIQDKVSIKTISYDEKSKTVTVSGPFDAEEVADRLSSKAGSKVITDMHVVGGGGIQKHGAKPGDVVSGHGHGGGHGGGKQPEKGYGGHVGGKPGKGYGRHVGGKPEKGHGGHGGGKPEMGHGGHGGGGKQEKGHGGGGFGHKPEKKHVTFDDMDDDDFDDDEPADRHGHHGNAKPRITNTPVAARLEAPRTGPSMSMAAMAPMRMPSAMPPQQQPQPQGMGVPSIWPPAPEWGYSAPAPQYGGWNGSGAGGMPAAGGYYGGGPAAYGHGGYGAPAYGYGRNPYGPPPQYYEEPSAGCSVM